MSLRLDIDVERLRAHHRLMHRIRAFEEQALRGLEEKVVLGAIHPSIGQEAIAAGICSNLAREDILLSTHRGHGHTLAKGADPLAMMRELFGREGGNCGGKGGSMHIADFSVGMLGANGVVAANISIAAGAAHAIKLKKRIARPVDTAHRLVHAGQPVVQRGHRLGCGHCGIGDWWSTPGWSSWKEADSVKMGRSCWTATTRRVVNERPSRTRSTSYTIGMAGSPGRMK